MCVSKCAGVQHVPTYTHTSLTQEAAQPWEAAVLPSLRRKNTPAGHTITHIQTHMQQCRFLHAAQVAAPPSACARTTICHHPMATPRYVCMCSTAAAHPKHRHWRRQGKGAATKPDRPARQNGHRAGLATDLTWASKLRAQPVHTQWQQPAIMTFALASKQIAQVWSAREDATTLSAMVLSMLTPRVWKPPAAPTELQDARLALLPTCGRPALLHELPATLAVSTQQVWLLLLPRLLMLP